VVFLYRAASHLRGSRVPSPRLLLALLAHDAEAHEGVCPPGFGVESAVMVAHVGEAPIGAADEAKYAQGVPFAMGGGMGGVKGGGIFGGGARR